MAMFPGDESDERLAGALALADAIDCLRVVKAFLTKK
jgi:hypothetical protein